MYDHPYVCKCMLKQKEDTPKLETISLLRRKVRLGKAVKDTSPYFYSTPFCIE